MTASANLVRLPEPPDRYNQEDEAENRRLIELAFQRAPGGGGLESRRTVTKTTASLASGAEETGTIDLGAPGVVLRTIQSDRACWLRPYPTAALSTADAARAITEDPPTGRTFGDFIWNTPHTKVISPPVELFNADSSVSNLIYYRVKNLSGTTGTITLTFVVVSIEK